MVIHRAVSTLQAAHSLNRREYETNNMPLYSYRSYTARWERSHLTSRLRPSCTAFYLQKDSMCPMDPRNRRMLTESDGKEMNYALEQKLYDDYPEIFQDKTLPPTKGLMCFGCECGDGWYTIIDALCQVIQDHSDYTGCQISAFQVKQKWGSLRFYVHGSDPETDGAVYMAEAMSRRTCENCGSTVGVQMTHGWIQPLCEQCRKVKNFDKDLKETKKNQQAVSA